MTRQAGADLESLDSQRERADRNGSKEGCTSAVYTDERSLASMNAKAQARPGLQTLESSPTAVTVVQPTELSSTKGEDEIEIPISDLLDENGEIRRIDVRAELDRERVDAYKLALKRGAKLPPILVHVMDGMRYVVSGWHRTTATLEYGEQMVRGIIRTGTFTEAADAAIEGNKRHARVPPPLMSPKSLN